MEFRTAIALAIVTTKLAPVSLLPSSIEPPAAVIKALVTSGWFLKKPIVCVQAGVGHAPNADVPQTMPVGTAVALAEKVRGIWTHTVS